MRNGEEVKETSAQPHWFVRKVAGLLGYYWVIGVDARRHPGCIEIVEIKDGAPAQVLYKRD